MAAETHGGLLRKQLGRSESEKRMIREIPIRFSEWVHWRERRRLATTDPYIGVYAWGHFHEQPAPDARPYPDLPAELIYVGETKNLNDRPLRSRDHVGLERYDETFPGDHGLDHLYVSVFRVECFIEGNERCRLLRAFTRHVEDLIYWEYAKTFETRAALDYARKIGYRLVVRQCCAHRDVPDERLT